MRYAHPIRRKAEGFTLLEVIGVLAVVAILVGLLVPKIFGAIHNALISQTASSLNTLKTACVGHYAQFSSLATDGSGNSPSTIALDGTDARALEYDKVLLLEALLENQFAPKIGDGILAATNTHVQIVTALAVSTQPTGDNAAYDLGANGLNEASGTVVVEAVITGVSVEDARSLNEIIDGSSLGEDSNGNDLVGRVKYAKPASSSANNNGNGNGNGKGNGNGDGDGTGNGKGNGNGNGQGNGNNGNGNGNGNGNSQSSQSASTVTVHVYITHR